MLLLRCVILFYWFYLFFKLFLIVFQKPLDLQLKVNGFRRFGPMLHTNLHRALPPPSPYPGGFGECRLALAGPGWLWPAGRSTPMLKAGSGRPWLALPTTANHRQAPNQPNKSKRRGGSNPSVVNRRPAWIQTLNVLAFSR